MWSQMRVPCKVCMYVSMLRLTLHILGSHKQGRKEDILHDTETSEVEEVGSTWAATEQTGPTWLLRVGGEQKEPTFISGGQWGRSTPPSPGTNSPPGGTVSHSHALPPGMG